jgi:general nucleoside transport system permease protein
VQTTPLIFAGLSFMFAFRAGIFNAGGQGQFIMGAFAAAWAGFTPGLAHLPPIIHIPLVVIAGAIGGALWSLPPILLKIYADTNEILTTLMMSYIADLLNDYLVLDVFRASTIQPGTNAQTPTLVSSAQFPTLFPQSQVTFMLPLGIALAVLIWAFFRWTVLGYELNLFGTGPRVARSGGVGSKKVMLTAMLGSGALAGMAGAAVVAGVFQADISPFTTNVGFDGILAALLARNLALAIPLTSLFFGAVEQGGLGLQIYTPISQYIADVLTATIIIFASARSIPRFSLRRFRSRAAGDTTR